MVVFYSSHSSECEYLYVAFFFFNNFFSLSFLPPAWRGKAGSWWWVLLEETLLLCQPTFCSWRISQPWGCTGADTESRAFPSSPEPCPRLFSIANKGASSHTSEQFLNWRRSMMPSFMWYSANPWARCLSPLNKSSPQESTQHVQIQTHHLSKKPHFLPVLLSVTTFLINLHSKSLRVAFDSVFLFLLISVTYALLP